VEDTTPPLTLTSLKFVWAGLNTVSGTARFDGVNVEDRPTHIFTARYDDEIMALEEGNNFIRFKSRLFRILDAKINDEDDIFIDIVTTERGIDTQLAALA
jgi:head-tail adaptor